MEFSTTSNISLRFDNNSEVKPLYVDERIVVTINRYESKESSSYMIQTLLMDVNQENLDVMREFATEILHAVNQISERLELEEAQE